MKHVVRIAAMLAAVVLSAVAGVGWWFGIRPLPKSSGVIQLALSKPAEIARDAAGVPHIAAATMDDVVFLQGFVHAQDRLFQMDGLRRLAAGELSEVIGPATLDTDKDSRRLRMRRVAEEHARTLGANDKRILATYARGVNAFLDSGAPLPVEFSLLGYKPRRWTETDSILAGLQMFRSLTTTWKDEVLKRSMLRKGEPEKVNFLFPVRTGSEVQLGSNAWAISGRLTASGKPLLANDPHLEWTFPGPWYTVHLRAEGLNVMGVSLPGVPMVIIGHNERIAWGITNLHYDVQDLYIEPQEAFLRREKETIQVKGRNPETLDVPVTKHGPVIITEGGHLLALRWVAAEPGGFGFPFTAINKAANWKEFTAALAEFTGPGSNFVYADVEGNIGYHAAGKLPVRKTYDGDIPTEGGKTEWAGFIPFAELPSVYNPASGMVITANQNPFPEKYAYRVNGNFSSHYRSRQIESRLKARSGWKPEEMLPIQMDLYSAFSHRLARELVRIWEQRGKGNPKLSAAAGILKNWDGQMRQDLAAPLIITLTFQHFRRAVAERAAKGEGARYELQMAPVVLEKLLDARPAGWFDDIDAVLLKSFSTAVEEGVAIKDQGDDPARWDYGRYTTFTLAHPVLSRVPSIGRWFSVGPTPMDGASTTVKQTTRRLGPSMRFIADLSDWDKSLHNITIGQSGHPFSRHFMDQWEKYYSGRSLPMQFSHPNIVEKLRVE
ncbi:MAG: penicillin acylase family protein [Candidatus Solibacter usitatus]|nr:penicillin acylase family protein [Candidatus Solibacter usitatus]